MNSILSCFKWDLRTTPTLFGDEQKKKPKMGLFLSLMPIIVKIHNPRSSIGQIKGKGGKSHDPPPFVLR